MIYKPFLSSKIIQKISLSFTMDRLMPMETCMRVLYTIYMYIPTYTVYLGHALNKITKDIINRYKLLQGHKI